MKDPHHPPANLEQAVLALANQGAPIADVLLSISQAGTWVVVFRYQLPYPTGLPVDYRVNIDQEWINRSSSEQILQHLTGQWQQVIEHLKNRFPEGAHAIRAH